MSKSFHRLLPLLLLIFIDSFSYFVVIPILLEIYFNQPDSILPSSSSEFMRNFLTGLTISLSTFAGLIASPLIGNASDKYGRKKTLLICLACTTLGFLIPIFGLKEKSIALILLGRVLSGIGSASQPVAQAAVADLCEGKEKALYLSFIALAMTIALVLGPLVGGYLSDPQLVSWFSASTPYLFSAIISMIIFCLMVFFFSETATESQLRSQMLSLSDIRQGLLSSLKNHRISKLLAIVFFLELGWSLYYQTISLFFMQHFHQTPQQVSVFNAYIGLLMCLGLLIYPFIMRILSIKKCLCYSLAIITFGFGGVCLAQNVFWHSVFASLITLFTGIAYVNLVTLISDQAPREHQGWAMGFTSTILFIAWLVTGIASGIILSLAAFLPFYLATAFLVLTWRWKKAI
jgi:MFS family permease